MQRRAGGAPTLARSLMGREMISENGVKGLNDGHKEEDSGNDERDDRPRGAEVSVLQGGPLNVPRIPVILVHLIKQAHQVITGVKFNIAGPQFRGQLFHHAHHTSMITLYDVGIIQILHVLLRLYQAFQ
ncbi:unnamed protein product [Cuscuta epithymum]|uniref:Uncharacterized protein n=1 Tax=Cuscuta epithymum TaxID=186058 RepID=A0AAV0EWZ1_9ASTE|nr:unnamed protein product [Cuscuta epithymum]